MPLTAGARLGPYEIGHPIGAGGMGEVYRARDMTLQRDVAIKLLPDIFAVDPDRVMRFHREAQTLAALNHPRIAQIYGVIETPPALVMEFVDAPDLSQRLAAGPLPLEEAISIARQLAEALKAKGFRVEGGQVNDGTGWPSWNNRTDRMLRALLPAKTN